MIGYVTLGTHDLERAKGFYGDLLSLLDANVLMSSERMVMWGAEGSAGMLAVCTPFDGEAATVGNGVMVALSLPSKAVVDQMHARALELGAANEGDPGPRGDGALYAGYFRDLDGNKLVGFCFG
jgi:predicted lactoylglutathione lyase